MPFPASTWQSVDSCRIWLQNTLPGKRHRASVWPAPNGFITFQLGAAGNGYRFEKFFGCFVLVQVATEQTALIECRHSNVEADLKAAVHCNRGKVCISIILRNILQLEMHGDVQSFVQQMQTGKLTNKFAE
jgi:hypothetical protein